MVRKFVTASPVRGLMRSKSVQLHVICLKGGHLYGLIET